MNLPYKIIRLPPYIPKAANTKLRVNNQNYSRYCTLNIVYSTHCLLCIVLSANINYTVRNPI